MSQNREQTNTVLLMEQTWVKIQERTFKRWCNTFLVERMIKIEDFMDDFTTGVQFCALLEIISAKKLGRINKKPRMKVQKLENVNAGLEFLKKEGIKLVNIGPGDIVDPNLKIILGLIWTIILRYQIQRGEDTGGSAKSELLKWVRSKIPAYDIKNFTKNWQDGKAICALAEALLPGQMDLPNDFSEDNLTNAQMGMDKAEENMEIPQVLYAEDMVGTPDELSNMTYISYFRDWEANHANVEAEKIKLRTPVALECIADGEGINKGEVLIPAEYVVEIRNYKGQLIPMKQEEMAGGRAIINSAVDGSGNNVEVEVTDNGDGTLTCVYEPVGEGDFVVSVTLGEEHIGKDGVKAGVSPYTVPIGAAVVDASKCTIEGPGIEGGNVGTTGEFTVTSYNRLGRVVAAGGAPFHLTVSGPIEGSDPKDAALTDNGDGTYSGVYTPVINGEHRVVVELSGDNVADSPYTVGIDRDQNASDPSQSWAEIIGEPNTCEPVKVLVHAVKPDGEAQTEGGEAFDVEVLDPEGDIVEATIKDNGDGTYDVEFEAEDPGAYKTDIFLRNKEIPTHIEHIKDFPQDINVDAGVSASETTVEGPGVEPEGVLEGEKTNFTITAKDQKGRDAGAKGAGQKFVVTILGPNGDVESTIEDKGNGTYYVEYTPVDSGDTAIEITLEEEQVANSPYQILVDPAVNAEKTVCSGPGLEEGNLDTEATNFTIETRDKNGDPVGEKGAGQPFKCVIAGPEGDIEAKIEDNGDGTYKVEYEPDSAGDYKIEVTLNEAQVADSPYTVAVEAGMSDNSKIEEYSFVVQANDKRGEPLLNGGETGNFVVEVDGPGEIEPAVIEDRGDGKYKVTYKLPEDGKYSISLKVHGKNIQGSPFTQNNEVPKE